MLPDMCIRTVVGFLTGEPHRSDCRYELRGHAWPQLFPLSRRFVPEPVQMTYIVTDVVVGSVHVQLGDLPMGTVQLGLAACTPSAIRQITELSSFRNVCASPDMDFQRICSICGRGAAEIRPVRHVTLQTRLRRPFWADAEAFRAFLNDRIVHVEINVCRNCVRRCNMP